MTHLRQAMLDELQRRKYATTTVQERFAKHFHRPPHQLHQPTCANIKRICCATESSSRGR